jgi:hypothetical protein
MEFVLSFDETSACFVYTGEVLAGQGEMGIRLTRF